MREPGTMHEDALATLLQAVARGDRDAFDALYRACAPRLFGVCLRLLTDRPESEEVLQEVFVSIWAKATQFDPGRSSGMAWLVTIARHKAIDRVRSRTSPLDPIEDSTGAIDPAASPLQVVEAADERMQLDLCLDQLEERRRNLIRTAFFEGATYEALAARTGSPLGSVKSWIRRGLAQLRTCLEA